MLKKYFRILLFILNIFVPGAGNVADNNIKLGSALLFLSFIIFFATPYFSLTSLRVLYLSIIVISNFALLKSGANVTRKKSFYYIIDLSLSFMALSVFALNFTYALTSGGGTDSPKKLVYVLGTKPFKLESMQNMLDMDDSALYELSKNDVHPFFRRLMAGINKVNENADYSLMISAGKNQKKLTQKILNKAGIKGEFFSCKSTKEEILAIKEFIDANDLAGAEVIMVSDDYHAFRVMLYSKLNNLKNVIFLSTSYNDSIKSFLKRYLIEQFLFLHSYIAFPISLSFYVI